MSFFERAWNAGADEYGRTQAQRYARRARALVVLGAFVAVLLVIGIVYVAGGPFG